jgi:translation initiation factor IF-1
MPRADMVAVEGVVIQSLPAAEFKIELASGHLITGYLSGKTRRNRIKILQRDRVRVEMSPYDLTRGRIVYRMK